MTSVQKSSAHLSSSDSSHFALTKSSNCSDLSGSHNPEDPIAAAPQMPVVQGPELQSLPYGFLPSDPGQWNIEDVYEFISALPGGSRLKSLQTFVKVLESCLRTLLMHPSSGRDTTSWTNFLSGFHPAREKQSRVTFCLRQRPDV